LQHFWGKRDRGRGQGITGLSTIAVIGGGGIIWRRAHRRGMPAGLGPRCLALRKAGYPREPSSPRLGKPFVQLRGRGISNIMNFRRGAAEGILNRAGMSCPLTSAPATSIWPPPVVRPAATRRPAPAWALGRARTVSFLYGPSWVAESDCRRAQASTLVKRAAPKASLELHRSFCRRVSNIPNAAGSTMASRVC